MIPAERSHLHVAAKSHAGMSGKNNEDRYAVSAFRLEAEKPLPVVFAIVSDGIGGHRAGEVAAEMAVEVISKAVAESDATQPINTLSEAIVQASEQILEYSESDTSKQGMGATCACAWVIDNRLYIAYVGDSRIYLLRQGKITQLSIDHTWIQEALNAGILDPEQAKGHPNAHVIRRYLGSRQPVEPDTRIQSDEIEGFDQADLHQGLPLSPGDQLFLCSDGLTDLVTDSEILTALSQKDQEEALEELIDLANQRGGHDNITVVSLQMPQKIAEPAPPISAPEKRQRNLAVSCASIILLVGILLGLVGGAYFFLQSSQTISPTPTLVNTPIPTQPFITPSEVLAPTNTSLPFDASPTPSLTNPPTPSPSPGLPTPSSTPWPTNTIET